MSIVRWLQENAKARQFQFYTYHFNEAKPIENGAGNYSSKATGAYYTYDEKYVASLQSRVDQVDDVKTAIAETTKNKQNALHIALAFEYKTGTSGDNNFVIASGKVKQCLPQKLKETSASNDQDWKSYASTRYLDFLFDQSSKHQRLLEKQVIIPSKVMANLQTENLVRALISCITNNDILVKLLTAKDAAGNTPLFYACKNGYLEVFDLLLHDDRELSRDQIKTLLSSPVRQNGQNLAQMLSSLSDDAGASIASHFDSDLFNEAVQSQESKHAEHKQSQNPFDACFKYFEQNFKLPSRFDLRGKYRDYENRMDDFVSCYIAISKEEKLPVPKYDFSAKKHMRFFTGSANYEKVRSALNNASSNSSERETFEAAMRYQADSRSNSVSKQVATMLLQKIVAARSQSLAVLSTDYSPPVSSVAPSAPLPVEDGEGQPPPYNPLWSSPSSR
jgi:hypothetical protein